MTERDYVTDITIHDLQEQHRAIAECVGVDGFMNLVRTFGGSGIYIPQMKEVVKQRVYRLIREEFDGTNIRALAVKYDVSESTVYNLVREQLQSGTYRHHAMPGQMSMADLAGNL